MRRKHVATHKYIVTEAGCKLHVGANDPWTCKGNQAHANEAAAISNELVHVGEQSLLKGL